MIKYQHESANNFPDKRYISIARGKEKTNKMKYQLKKFENACYLTPLLQIKKKILNLLKHLKSISIFK